MITTEQFASLFPKAENPEAWADAINRICPHHGIDTPQRLIHFLAQFGHETAGFTYLVENLNYTATRLLQIWPKRFTAKSALQYAGKPEAIANRVYGGRMGNGPEPTGDGWKYRGRGVQLTGKSNYLAFAKAIGKSLEETVAFMETVAGTVESGCWYWETRNLNTMADHDEIKALTLAINGGYNGLADREQKTEQIASALTA